MPQGVRDNIKIHSAYIYIYVQSSLGNSRNSIGQNQALEK